MSRGYVCESCRRSARHTCEVCEQDVLSDHVTAGTTCIETMRSKRSSERIDHAKAEETRLAVTDDWMEALQLAGGDWGQGLTEGVSRLKNVYQAASSLLGTGLDTVDFSDKFHDLEDAVAEMKKWEDK